MENTSRSLLGPYSTLFAGPLTPSHQVVAGIAPVVGLGAVNGVLILHLPISNTGRGSTVYN